MKKIFLFVVLMGLFVALPAQVNKSKNSSLDSLKEGVKNIGRLFKKASVVNITVKNIEANDKNLNLLLKNVKQLSGVTKVKESYESNNALILVSYKGDGTELWDNVSKQSKQMFDFIQVNDSSIILNYKYAKTPVVKNNNANEKPVENQTTRPVTNPNPDIGKTTTIKTTDKVVLTKGAALLFNNVKSKLNNSEKNLIFKLTNFIISRNGKEFAFDGGEDYPFSATVYPVDLNKDGKEELFVLFGNTYTSGMAASSIVVYILDKKGGYQAHLGFPGTIPDVLATANLGYPDLLIGGPGFEFPVQRWDGKTYNFYRKVKDRDYANLKKNSLEDLSKAYTATIK